MNKRGTNKGATIQIKENKKKNGERKRSARGKAEAFRKSNSQTTVKILSFKTANEPKLKFSNEMKVKETKGRS